MISFYLNRAIQLPEILGAAGDRADVEGWAKKAGVWANKEGVWAKNMKVCKECILGAKMNFTGQRKFNHVWRPF